LSIALILKGPDWEKEFHVHTDASTYAIGCVLTQLGESKINYPVYFASRQLDTTERNYTTIEREGLTIVFSCKKFRNYLLANHFTFYIDHHALLYLVNKPCTNGRIIRWLLLLQEFDFEIVIRKGKQYFMFDHLSRVRNGEPSTRVDDELPDAVLFKVDYASKEYKGIVKYLMSGRLTPRMTKLESRQLIRRVGPYQLKVGQIYVKGKDEVIRRRALPQEIDDILYLCHDGMVGGHFASNIIAQKVLQVGI